MAKTPSRLSRQLSDHPGYCEQEDFIVEISFSEEFEFEDEEFMETAESATPQALH